MSNNKKRTPTAKNGSPLSPPAETSTQSKPQFPNPTSPLTSTMCFRRQAGENFILAKVQEFTSEQRLFLAHDFEEVSHRPKKLDYYNIIQLFHPNTKSRPTDKKDDLKKVFLDGVRPLLKPYLLPPVPVSMETDTQPDFDPLSRKTTHKMLSKAIEQKSPKFPLPNSATIDDTLIVYKHFVDPGLRLPNNDRFVKRPRTVPINRLKNETIEDLLFALRYLAPFVFVRSLAMNKPCLVDLYTKFVHDETPSIPLILGFHYTILELSAADFEPTVNHQK